MLIDPNLFALCRIISPFSSLGESETDIQWKSVVGLAKKHRISALMHHHLHKNSVLLEKEAATTLKKDAHITHLKMLRLSRELICIHRQFEENNIDTIHLKGPVQSMHIFGNVSLKNSRDLDILIDKCDVQPATQLLREMGYKTPDFFEAFSECQKAYFLGSQNQLVCFHTEKKICVELHWRLFANKNLLHFEFNSLLKEATLVEIAGTKLRTLNETPLILYLIVHGSKHRWAILYWMVEICYYIKTSHLDLDTLYEESKKLKVQRPFLQFVGLAQQLFGLNTSNKLAEELSNGANTRLISIALDAINNPKKTPAEKSVANYARLLSYKMNLKKGLAYKLGYFNFISPNDFELLSLPDALFFLYYPLRPFLWCTRYLIK